MMRSTKSFETLGIGHFDHLVTKLLYRRAASLRVKI